jgi:hypothetical protein
MTAVLALSLNSTQKHPLLVDAEAATRSRVLRTEGATEI